MLILSRKNGQKIIINDNIEITILETKNDNCKIAIQAPKEVKVYREEVYIQIKNSNKMSNDTSKDALSNISGIVAPLEASKKKTVIIKKKSE